MDAFRQFDIDGKGYITSLELTMGLMNLKINYTQSEISAFFKYFDLEGTKKVRFSDFSKAFLPFNKDKAAHILKREPINIQRQKNLELIFQK